MGELYVESIVNFCEEKKIQLDFNKKEILSNCQEGLEECLKDLSDKNMVKKIIIFAEEKNIPISPLLLERAKEIK
ncbi:MAG: hypothetical protein V1649_03300 [Patescibacteria group bacterium]